MRLFLVLLIILALAPVTCVYEARKPWNRNVTLRLEPVPLPAHGDAARHLGAFALEGVWQLHSDYGAFGSYSALLPQPGGRLLALGDSGGTLIFSPPGARQAPPLAPMVFNSRFTTKQDVEAATRDPATGTIWIAREGMNAITRHDARLRLRGLAHPPAMRDWPENTGPEAMVRLADGRFIVLSEDFSGLFERRRHPALLFPGDPTAGVPGRRGAAVKPLRFVFEGAEGYSPTDMAQMPDGRVLVLMRRLVWPFPVRFEGRIEIADPAAIRAGGVWPGRVVAHLSAPLPVDNFEGLAIVPRADGTITVWLIADENHASTQRALLWRLTVDPAALAEGGVRRCIAKPR